MPVTKKPVPDGQDDAAGAFDGGEERLPERAAYIVHRASPNPLRQSNGMARRLGKQLGQCNHALDADVPLPDRPVVMSDDASSSAGHRERLRQRLLAGGGDGFHDYELLEYLLALAIPRQDTKPLAKRLLEEFGSLAALIAATPEELKRVDGLGDGAAAAIKFVEAVMLRSLRTKALDRQVLSGWQALLDYLHAALAHRPTEQFRVIFLNNRNVMIRDEMMNDGTVNAAPVYPREIVKRALDLGAAAVVLVHNHPSGDPQPSRDDIQMTRAIIEAGRHLGLTVHDHVIIGATGHVSMRAQGLI